MHLLADGAILRPDLAAEGTVGATEDRAALSVCLCLALVNMLEISPQTVQRRDCRRKNLIHSRLLSPPVRLQGFNRELRFRLEEMIETALLRAGLLTDCIDRG